MTRVLTFAGWLFFSFWAVGTAVIVAGRVLNPFFNDLWQLGFVPLAIAILRGRRDRRMGGAFAGVGLLFLLCGIRPTGPVATRAFVLGVDGATFDVIDSHSDELPEFAKLGPEATRATLTSMEPMFSPLLWTTIASGRPPDEHGIKGFRVQSHDCQVARFWDIAENAGMGVGLYKWLVDYPPRTFKHGGFWVPSWLAPEMDTWPADLSVVKELELSKRMRRKQIAATHSTPELAFLLVKAGVRASTLLAAIEWSLEEKVARPSPVRANVRMQTLRGAIDRDVFIRQLHLHQPDLATFTYYATDGLAHLYWEQYEQGGDELMAAYRQADRILGEIRAQMGPDATLVVVSDHGFKAMDAAGAAGQFAPLTERLRARITAEVGTVDVSKVGHKLTVGFTDSAQMERGRAFLVTLLDARGQPFYRVEPVPDMATALALTLTDEQITGERLASDTVGGEGIKDYVKLTDAYTGTHKDNGIFYAVGRGVTGGEQLDPLHLIDVAPTVLASLGLPASDEMTGRAVVWPEVPRVADWDHLLEGLIWIGVESAEEVNTDALKALGYIDDAAPSEAPVPGAAAP